MYVLICVLLLITLICVMITIGFALYKRSFFRSNKFVELSRKSDVATEQYEDLIGLIQKFNKLTYANFFPTEEQQRELQENRDVALVQNKTLAPYSYFCTHQIIMQKSSTDILQNFCGFSATPGVLEKLKDMQKMSIEIERKAKEFGSEYEKQVSELSSEVPTLIRLFARKQLMFLLGLQINNHLLSNLYPTYTFKDMSNIDTSMTIALAPGTIETLIVHIESCVPQNQTTWGFGNTFGHE